MQPLLGYLALAGPDECSRDLLLDALWPDVEPAKARQRLNTTTWRLRGLLGPEAGAAAVVSDRSGRVGLDRELVELDIAPLLSLTSRQAAVAATIDDDELRVVLARADTDAFLQGCYHDWVLGARERMRLDVDRLVDDRVTARLDRGDHRGAVAWAELLVARDPYREDMHRLLIELYDSLGRPAESIRQFDLCVRILGEDLGVKPLPETVLAAAAVGERRGRDARGRKGAESTPQAVVALDQAMTSCRSALEALDEAVRILRAMNPD